MHALPLNGTGMGRMLEWRRQSALRRDWASSQPGRGFKQKMARSGFIVEGNSSGGGEGGMLIIYPAPSSNLFGNGLPSESSFPLSSAPG